MDGRDALRLAASTASRGVALKYGAIGGACLLAMLFLVGLLGAGSGGQAHADSCGDIGQPGSSLPAPGPGSGQNPGGDLRKKQIENAKIIDRVAEQGGLSGKATLVGLMTALQESTLLNIDYGDRDSLGLFQQRPSQGWGSPEQILNPEYSSKMFFFGADSGSPRGLADIRGWEAMPLWKAAATVQRPAEEYEHLYAGQETPARQIATEAGLNLLRAAEAGFPGPSGGGVSVTPTPTDGCYPELPANPGAPFHDGSADWPENVKNPRSTADAIKWAKSEAATGGKDWYQLCLAFVARTYGWSFSGVNYAIDHYREMPSEMKHDKDRNPPPGALMYWDTGKRAGHVAIYLGNGEIASNDIRRPGYIDVVPATDIESVWGATYLGWAPPYFPKGG
ncbi:peptidase M23 [Streptomyces hydrogenans]